MKRPTDEQVDVAIGIVLRTGVMAAALLVLAGGIAYLLHDGGDTVAYRTFQGARGAVRGPLYVVQLGLIVLMATPVARVIACVVGFGLERDLKYVVISTIVLGLLVFSLR